ncbi:MAG: molybdopterin-binding protein, partial [Oscillospiraceae bacterium]|nr:molybdopterin-binding protein [Oscillospiraceae bacterium]
MQAAVITISDKATQGLREDTSGPAVAELLIEAGYTIAEELIIPDEQSTIEQSLIHCADERMVALIVTTGGTGFSPRDITPEATLAVCERLAPGLPEAMRAHSMTVTPRAMLSRAQAGIRGKSLILNLPGSPKAAVENLQAVLPSLTHGLEILQGKTGECATTGRVLSVNISETKGHQKTPIPIGTLIADHGLEGDAHAGTGRQVSLLANESIDKLRVCLSDLAPGAFAENIVTEGLTLHTLPVGTKLKIGTALTELTQIGKDCH